MNRPNLEQVTITNPQVNDELTNRRTAQAMDLAAQQVASALSDMGLVQIFTGNRPAGFKILQDAQNICPANQTVFHNLVALLLQGGGLRNNDLRAIKQRLLSIWNKAPWARDYAHLLFLPTFLNIEFIKGKCNLKCRMCVGTQSPDYPDQLSYLKAADFEKMLQAASTVGGLTLSAGNSEPLLHPELETIFALAARHGVKLDIFTNGLPLTEQKCRAMIESKSVSMLNFSLDAATAETYRCIRGGDFNRAIGNIEMLQRLKAEMQSQLPWVSFSFVAMADTIAELPDFVKLAGRLGAQRVAVEDLIGWDNRPSDNRLATDHPQWAQFIAEAVRLADELKLSLILPQRLRPSVNSAAPAAESSPLQHCGWLEGVWVQETGQLDPCCLIHGVADMGSIHDGPLHRNEKYNRVKSLLLEGKVFPACRDQRQCIYVQQQQSAGQELRFITPAEIY